MYTHASICTALQVLHGLRELPTPDHMLRLTAAWAPYRSVGSYYMWHIPPPPRSPSASPAKPKPKAKPGKKKKD